MNKDKEWLLEKIKENSRMPAVIVFDEYQYYVKETDVKKWIGMLNEPKLPEIPQFVADWIKECKTRKHNLFGVYQFAPELVSVWIFENESKKERVDLIARAWLGDYTVEKEPDKLYEVKLPTENAMGYLINIVQAGNKKRVWLDSLDDRIVKFQFTEQEIRAIDERYWAFAVEVKR